MKPAFFPQIYDSWNSKQLQKYRHLFLILKTHVSRNCSLLDLGIGKAWFEDFLLRKGFQFSKIVGIDVSEDAVSPKKPFIEYLYSSPKEKFDFVVCFDSFHLLEDKDIRKFLKPKGIALISLPFSKKHLLSSIKGKKLAEGVIGIEEKDWFVLLSC